MKLRLEIGRKLLRSSVDRDGFLRRGWTRACLNDNGKIPSERERLTRFVMIGPSSDMSESKMKPRLRAEELTGMISLLRDKFVRSENLRRCCFVPMRCQ